MVNVMNFFTSQTTRAFHNPHHIDNVIDISRGALVISRYRKGIAIDKPLRVKLLRPFQIARKQDRQCLFSFLRNIKFQSNGVARIWAGRVLANDYRRFYLKSKRMM